MKSKVLYLVIAAVLLIAGGLWFALKGGDAASDTDDSSTTEEVTDETTESDRLAAPGTIEGADGTATEPQSFEVLFTNEGFTPSSVTINAGDSVVFINNSSDNFQPASNPHPVHTDLSGFVAEDEIEPGGSFSFTFIEVGTWGFHNHLDEDQTGEIIVE